MNIPDNVEKFYSITELNENAEIDQIEPFGETPADTIKTSEELLKEENSKNSLKDNSKTNTRGDEKKTAGYIAGGIFLVIGILIFYYLFIKLNFYILE